MTFTAMALWPFIEKRITGDVAEHHLLDNPRDAPTRTAVGVVLLFFAILTLAGGNDVLAITFQTSVEANTWVFRIAIILIPVVGGTITRRICMHLSASTLHPLARTAGVELRRNPQGGFDAIARATPSAQLGRPTSHDGKGERDSGDPEPPPEDQSHRR
jgi:ubiquinol-cytochrome c reductase cytochrome b subunit